MTRNRVWNTTPMVVLLALLPLSGQRAAAFERFDFDQRYLIDPGFIIKDHSVVRDDSDTYHIFYIRADESVPEGQRAKSLGHATSTNFKHWTIHPEVIPVVADTWEESFIWAPHIVRDGGTWYMFYTGVNRWYAQATGVATSTDLFSWTKYSGNPVYTPDTTWANWSSGAWSNCRDPFVVQDSLGTWHLMTTAWTNQSQGAVSHATSPDLLNWVDQGPLFVHPGPQAWHVLESANVHPVNGKWHLTFTEQNVGGSSYLQADDLLGPWNYDDRVPLDAGHATELFQIDSQWMLSRHTTFWFDGGPRFVIRFDDVDWSADGKPLVLWEEPLSEWQIWSGNAFYLQPVFWDNSLARGSQASNFGGNSWIGTAELFTGPLLAGYPGLAAGEEPVGTLRSKTWTLTGNRIRFRIGGGSDLFALHLALYTADDDVLRRIATGSDSDAMIEEVWEVDDWVGRPVYLQIVDAATGPWGHINVDEIEEFYDNSPPTSTGRTPAAYVLHGNVPNPFNPSTRIDFELPAAAAARLVVFDVRGRLIRSLAAGTLPAGRASVVWDGRTDAGQPVASGLYWYQLRVDGRQPLQRPMLLLR